MTVGVGHDARAPRSPSQHEVPQVVEYDPDCRVRVRTTRSTIPLDITREVVPRPDGGTTLHAIIRGEPTGVLRLLGPLTQRMVERNVRADDAQLRAMLDG